MIAERTKRSVPPLGVIAFCGAALVILNPSPLCFKKKKKNKHQSCFLGITLQWYKPVTKMLISDHKPVSAMFDMDCRKILPEKREQVQKSLGLQLDRQENDAFPRVTLNSTNLDFGVVKFDTPSTKPLILENVGQVFVEWRFAERRANKPVCSPWYKVELQSGLLLPNESVEINITCLVTKEHSFGFQIGIESLEEIIILKLENGRDYFITMRGTYAKSCFGTNLHYLVNTPEPVRYSHLQPPEEVLSIPKELWRMVDFIFRTGSISGLSSRRAIYFRSGRGWIVHDLRPGARN